MQEKDALEKSLELANRSSIAFLGTYGDNGYPDVRAMLKMENEGLKKIWFSANTSSEKIEEIKKNPRSCVYFVDLEKFSGLTIFGKVEILRDSESRRRLWKDGFETYYPLGVDDPDYSVLKFTGKYAKYYHGLVKSRFEV